MTIRSLKRLAVIGVLVPFSVTGLASPSRAASIQPWFDFSPQNWQVVAGSPSINQGSLQLNLNESGTDEVMNSAPFALDEEHPDDRCTTVDHRANHWIADRVDFDLAILGSQAPAGHPTDLMYVMARDITRGGGAYVLRKSFMPGDPFLTDPSDGSHLRDGWGPGAEFGNDLPVWTILHETVDLSFLANTGDVGDTVQIIFAMKPGSTTAIFELQNPVVYSVSELEDVGPCYGPWVSIPHPVP